jgi:hypothetical protein
MPRKQYLISSRGMHEIKKVLGLRRKLNKLSARRRVNDTRGQKTRLSLVPED